MKKTVSAIFIAVNRKISKKAKFKTNPYPKIPYNIKRIKKRTKNIKKEFDIGFEFMHITPVLPRDGLGVLGEFFFDL
jgi:hypothetical protein